MYIFKIETNNGIKIGMDEEYIDDFLIETTWDKANEEIEKLANSLNLEIFNSDEDEKIK